MSESPQRGVTASPGAATDALTAVARRWPIVLACVVVAAGVGFGVSVRSESEYTATASLLFRDPGLDKTFFGTFGVSEQQDQNRVAATNEALVAQPIVAQLAASALGDGFTKKRIQSSIDVSSDGQSDLVNVAARDHRPRLAAKIANAVVEQFIAYRRSADQAKVAAAQRVVQQQLDDALKSTGAVDSSSLRLLRQRASQLGVLRELQTGGVELAQPAAVPSVRSSPKTKRTTIVAALFGALIGVGMAVVLTSRDRRVLDPEEFEAIWDTPVLAVLPQSTALSKSGRDLLPGAEFDAFAMVRSRLRYFNVDRSVRRLVVTSAMMGEGKSTASWHLASAVAASGSSVVLLETDLRRPTLRERRDLGPGPGLSEVLAGIATLADATVSVGLSRAHGDDVTFDVIPAGAQPPNPVELLEGSRLETLLDTLADRHDLIIIDTAPILVVPDALPLLQRADGIIVVARANLTTRDAASRLRVEFSELGVHASGLVVNGYTGAGGAGQYGYGYGYGYASDR